MGRRLATCVLTALGALALPNTAGAQARHRPRVAVSAGTVLLSGSRNRYLYRAGQTASLGVLVPIDDAGFSVRADASMLQVPSRNHRLLVDPTADSLTVGSFGAQAAIVSGVLEPASHALPVRPFLSVGGGVYHMRSRGSQAGADASWATTSFAVVYGAGASFPLGRFRALVEGHAYNLYSGFSSLRVFPVTVGLQF